MNARAAGKYRVLFTILVLTIYLFTLTGSAWRSASAQEVLTGTPTTEPGLSQTPVREEINPYFSIEHRTLPDGTSIAGYIINGPPAPLAEYEAQRTASIRSTAAAIIIPDFPSFNWVFGCSAVSGAMIAGYYDRGAYPNMYTGPTNGGVMPLTDTSWSTWSDGVDPYPNNPLIASHLGVDGLAVRGSIDDYWVQYGSSAADPYITGSWTQHTWGSAIGDFMKTSQSAYSNTDGSTTFYTWTGSSDLLTCSQMVDEGIDDEDGTYGRKLFYEARGYTVTDCYNQNTDNNVAGGFSLANFQAEINAGHAVMLNLEGHTIVGYGYDGSTIYIRDTWDNNPANTYTMPWGGSYEGMTLLSVSVVNLAPVIPDTERVTLPMLLKHYLSGQSPTDILLSNSTVEEDMPINTVVGTLSSIDANIGDTFTYSLVSGAGDTGNASFNILGNQLRTSAVFDYETQNSYSIRMRTTDQNGLFFEKAFTITIVPGSNLSPTNILLSSSAIAESQPVNTVVGTLSTTDPDVGDTFTYSLVPGSGDTGNGSFNIVGNQLRSSVVFDYETQNSYSVRMRTTDQGGLFYEKAFTITITNVSESTILNGDFEQGHVAWTEYSSGGWDLIYPAASTPVTAHSGAWIAWLGGADLETSRLSQAFSVPAGTSMLHYWYWSSSEDACYFDYFRIKVNGTTVFTRDLCSATDTGGWVEASLSLAAYANTTITLMFEVTTDSSLNSNIFLDDVSMSSTLQISPHVVIPDGVDLDAVTKER
jgi:hypothetical protein